MISFYIFVASGAALAAITFSKRIEMRRKRKIFILELVSKADENLREFWHEVLRLYSEEKGEFFIRMRKQLPLKARSAWNRFAASVKEKSNERFGEMRNARLLKKSDGLSEFFKNISEIEKGGEIHDPGFKIQDLGMESIPEIPKPKRKYTRRKVRTVEVK
jgi:hypothetical protein